MNYETFEDKNPEYAGCWRVEAIDFEGDGDCYVTLFSGPQSEKRAKRYGLWMNALEYNSAARAEGEH